MTLPVSRMVGTFAVLTLLTGVALPQLASAENAPMSPVGSRPKPAPKERHPELQAALRALETARNALQKGAHDFGGERAEALKDTDKAIAELKQAIAKDKN